jgi:ABC-type nitrate/sulfonate/bicarbonate transport system ATPase subunit
MRGIMYQLHPQSKGRLMAESVTLGRIGKTYQTQSNVLTVLDDVQFHIVAGEFVAVLGPSGCGKSTLLRLVAGLDQPSSGTVRLGERVVTDVDARCAVMFQEPRLFPWQTIRANVALGARRAAHASPPNDLLALVGLSDFADAYPHQLSGGMAQRAALARALIGQPGVLLLDEPFAALDAFTRMQMQDVLAEAARVVQPTVVMVTHDIDEALYLADRIIILGHRPASVVATVNIPLPRPRDRADAALAPLRRLILSHFGFSHAEPLELEVNAI